ncbi:MAG: 16S rRNA (cytidine(1402)-2'-O)-methyltransferase [Candidatus Moranbacteria bacterium]|nr:16S rRNA (cytidine(1402)-2'-O)-methyltransferase [Candidatus Moranbacteria bacterium]
MGTLFIVATPIGNMEDITLRALRVLRECDAVLAEDTRVTKKLLAKYEIEKPAVSCHEHTDEAKLLRLVGEMKEGKTFAYVTDAGTPGLSDPGNKLVSLASGAGVAVSPIPGASALGAIVSVAGIDMREFLFLGFPPHKKGRETFFKKVVASEHPVVYYESPHRVMKNLELLGMLASESKVIIGRELTKMFEEVIRGTVGEATGYFEANPSKVKGEFVIVVYR